MNVEERVKQLETLISEYKVAYYQDDNPIVADELYDARVAELNYIYQRNPELKSNSKPSCLITMPLSKTLERVEHVPTWLPPAVLGMCPYQSLETYLFLLNAGFEEERDSCSGKDYWTSIVLKGVVTKLELPKNPLCIVPVLDGLPVSVVYKDGILSHILTRGDGTWGEDIASNVIGMDSIPTEFMFSDTGSQTNVIGTIVFKNNSDVTDAKLMLSKGLRHKGSTEINPQDLHFYPNEVICLNDTLFYMNHFDKVRALERAGFDMKYAGDESACENSIVEKDYRRRFIEASECVAREPKVVGLVYRSTNKLLGAYMLEEDSLTNLLDSVYDYNSLFRPFKASRIITTVKEIVNTIDRHGVIHPIVVLSPIKTHLGGINKIHNWTLKLPNHNYLFNEIKIVAGDTVVVSCSDTGHLSIVENLGEFKVQQSVNPIDTFTSCPHCGSDITGLAPATCSKWEECTGVLTKVLEYWVSSHINNITELSTGPCSGGAIEAMVSTGLVNNIFDLYTFDYEKAREVLFEYGFDSGVISMFIADIAKSIGMSQLLALCGLSIPGVDVNLASALLNRYKDINHVMNPGPWSCFDNTIPRLTERAHLSLCTFRKNKNRVDDVFMLTTPAPLNNWPKESGLVSVVSPVNTLHNTSLLKGLHVSLEQSLMCDSLAKSVKQNGGILRSIAGKTNVILTPIRNITDTRGYTWSMVLDGRMVLEIGLADWNDSTWTDKFIEAMSSNGPTSGIF